MCGMKKPKAVKPAGAPEAPQPAAEDPEIGGSRTQEDQSVYGATGEPQLRRTDPSATGPLATGTGLRMM